MIRLVLTFGIFAVALTASPALAYGPYAHVYIAQRAAKNLTLEGDRARYFTLGALLADVDKSSRLAAAMGGTMSRLLQGCTAEATLSRDATHSGDSALVRALIAHSDPRARALGRGMRSHGVVDRYADETAKAKLGRANSGNEDLTFDVAYARKDLAGAKDLLASILGAKLNQNAEVAGWIAGAAGADTAKVSAQMRGYGCFLKNFVSGKASMFAGLLRAALAASWTKECVRAASGLRARLKCVPSTISRRWDSFTAAHREIISGAIDAVVKDARATSAR
jgi:hypothetical protein